MRAAINLLETPGTMEVFCTFVFLLSSGKMSCASRASSRIFDGGLVMSSILQLQNALGPELSKTELVPAYQNLLRDGEAEVRTAAAGKLKGAWRFMINRFQNKPVCFYHFSNFIRTV